MIDRAFIDQLADTWSATASVCGSLAPTAWDADTDCPGWTVRDQLSHIVGTESMLLGHQAPPAADPAEHVRNPIGEMNEAWVAPRRTRAGSEVLAEFAEVTAARLSGLRAMTDAELERDSPSPIGIVPYATFMDVRVMDCWVHEQDIRRAVGQPGHLDGPAPDAALTRLLSSFGYVVGKRVGPADGLSVAVELTGRQPMRRVVVMRDGRAQPAADGADPNAVIVVDAGVFAALVAGRWNAERAFAAGALDLRGDTAVGQAVVRNLATIP